MLCFVGDCGCHLFYMCFFFVRASSPLSVTRARGPPCTLLPHLPAPVPHGVPRAGCKVALEPPGCHDCLHQVCDVLGGFPCPSPLSSPWLVSCHLFFRPPPPPLCTLPAVCRTLFVKCQGGGGMFFLWGVPLPRPCPGKCLRRTWLRTLGVGRRGWRPPCPTPSTPSTYTR